VEAVGNLDATAHGKARKDALVLALEHAADEVATLARELLGTKSTVPGVET
jgi:hypothetical protein